MKPLKQPKLSAKAVEDKLMHSVETMMEAALRPKALKFRQAPKGLAQGPRLNRAFSLFLDNCLIAYQDHACCQSCGRYDVEECMNELPKTQYDMTKGFVFYHVQDTDSARETGKLFLSYGEAYRTKGKKHVRVCATPAMTYEEVGHLICDLLTEAGLKWVWNGKSDTRIMVDLSST